MACPSNAFINSPPIVTGSNFSLWKCRIKYYIESINYDLWDIITDGPFTPTWIRNDGSNTSKPKGNL